MYKSLRIALLVLLWLYGSLLPIQAKAKKDDVSKMVEPTHSGIVAGQVYDAVTKLPIQNASVCIQDDGVFPQTPEPPKRGKRTAKVPQRGVTDTYGRYKCQAKLGRISKSINVWRLLNSSVIGLITGSATKITKRIDITFVNIRIECQGYHAFEGMVPVKRRDVEGFTVIMDPILLTPQSSDELSTVASGWGAAAIVDIAVEPPIARPRAKVKITVRIQCPPIDNSTKMKVVCTSPFSNKKIGLLPDKSARMSEGWLIYSGVFQLPNTKTSRAELITVQLSECPYSLMPWGESKSTLLQVVSNEQEDSLAQLRLKAFQLRTSDNNIEASKCLQALCENPTATTADFIALATVSEVIHDYPTAIASRKRLLEIAQKSNRLQAMGLYAHTLLLAGDYVTILAEVAPELKKVKTAALVKTVPIAMPVAVGMAYLKTGQFEEAEQINRKLNSWPTANWTPEIWTFRADLRLAQTEEELRKRPDEAQAWANYGRALMDVKRWEEAVEKLQEALKRDPSLASVRWELNYARLYLQGTPQQTRGLDEAIASAQKEVVIGTGKKQTKSKNFYAWHTLGILLYRKATAQFSADDMAATKTLQQCREALMEALICGREGKEQVKESKYYGYWGYYGSDVIAIAGFAYPEANQDFIIFKGMKVLDKHPEDALTRQNMALAFIELNLPDLADGILRPIAGQSVENVDVLYLRSLIAAQREQPDQAMELLRGVLIKNPRHPSANRKLAQLYTENGDMVAASACLAAHAKIYGMGTAK